jgi:hypothetical protein
MCNARRISKRHIVAGQSLSSESNICKQDQEPTFRVESVKTQLYILNYGESDGPWQTL